ncbi:MAG: CHAT domain-containing protein [Cyclobacteriaceae bacterium]|nr:CHAT domain-containing protein [Cyclobacteriaceae bacterium]
MPFFSRFLSATLLLISSFTLAQEKSNYKLEVSSGYDGKDEIIQLVAQPIRLNFKVQADPYQFNATIPGKLKIIASTDSIPDVKDHIVLDSACTLPDFSYTETPVRHNLKPGTYYLFISYEANDQNLWLKKSNTVFKKLHLLDVTINVTEAWLADFKTSEFNDEKSVHIEIDLNLSCCAHALGKFNSQWEVGLAKEQNGSVETIQTFYPRDSLLTASNKFVLEESVYTDLHFSGFRFMVVRMTSAYFSEGYRTIPDQTFTVPLTVIRDAKSLNAMRRKQYPFLTYGEFDPTDKQLGELNVEGLYSEAEKFYKLTTSVLKAIQHKQADVALQYTDSAFALAGSQKASTLLFVAPGIVSNLYSGIMRWADVYKVPIDREGINFRLSEAMKMEDLIERGYKQLTKKILPDSLWLRNEMEKGGFYDAHDLFQHENITNLPVVWVEHTVPALEHFIRVVDFESADNIVTRAGKHVKLVKPLWNLLAADTSIQKHFACLGSSLSEHNDMLAFCQARLHYYAQSGLYAEGEEAVAETSKAYACGYQFAPIDFWKAAGNFYEAMGTFTKADSLYRLCDAFLKEEREKKRRDEAISVVHESNAAMLKSKLEGNKEARHAEAIMKALESVSKKNVMVYLDLASNREVAQKLGFLGSDIYVNLYWNQFKQLEEQRQHFVANEWLKDLAFLLGRDGKYDESLTLYHNAFIIENLKATAFRLGFSEEAQLFYSQKMQDDFSRYLNVALAYQQSGQTERLEEVLQNCYQQVLFNHAFILRGNFRLLYDVYRSENTRVHELNAKWQLLREYLNKLYVARETDKNGMALLKAEILKTEKELIRLSRDTSSMALDYITPVDSIRKKLKADEAAIEIIRYKENGSAYYGSKVRYAALVVTPSSTKVIAFPTAGQLMEGRQYKLYRNSILYKLADVSSYAVYWAPVKEALNNVRKIYWAPDGVFHLININTLFNPETQRYAVEEMEIETIPTIAHLSSHQPLNIKSATLLGNPVYGPASTPAADTTRSSREFFTEQPITRLPGTQKETETIAALLKQKNVSVTVLTDARATKQALFEKNQVDVLHLATHGFWIDQPASGSSYRSVYETLSGSGLVLAHAQERNGADKFKLIPSGIVTAAEIQDMNLFRTRLVVLSACETGLGEVVPGEGLYGLKRSLQRAGVEHIVTSLWKVDDEATMRFMTAFYESLVLTGQVSESFLRAMVSLKQVYPEPYYWGAFVLTSGR